MAARLLNVNIWLAVWSLMVSLMMSLNIFEAPCSVVVLCVKAVTVFI